MEGLFLSSRFLSSAPFRPFSFLSFFPLFNLQDDLNLNFSVSVFPGTGCFEHTKFIQIEPMYWFVNHSPHSLDFRQHGSDSIFPFFHLFLLYFGTPPENFDPQTLYPLIESFTIAPNKEFPFYWSESGVTTRNLGLVVRIHSEQPSQSDSSFGNQWSHRFFLDELGDYHVKLTEKKNGKKTDLFFDMDIFLKKGRQYVVFRLGEAPFRLENHSKVSFSFFLFLFLFLFFYFFFFFFK